MRGRRPSRRLRAGAGALSFLRRSAGQNGQRPTKANGVYRVGLFFSKCHAVVGFLDALQRGADRFGGKLTGLIEVES